jgi:hypothetical protein
MSRSVISRRPLKTSMLFGVAIPLTSLEQYRADLTSLTEKKPLGEQGSDLHDLKTGRSGGPANLSPVKAVMASLNRLRR